MNEQYFTSLNGYIVKDPKSIHTYNTVLDMKSDIKLKDGALVKTKGYYNVNDGGSAEYYIRNKTNEDIEDNGLIHFITDYLVAELLVKDDKINVKQFGAKGDGSTDVTTIIQSCVNNFSKVYIPDGIYVISDTIVLPKNHKIEGESIDNTIIKGNGNGKYIFQYMNSYDYQSFNALINQMTLTRLNENNTPKGIDFSNGSIKLTNLKIINITNPIHATGQYKDNIYIENVTATYSPGYGENDYFFDISCNCDNLYINQLRVGFDANTWNDDIQHTMRIRNCTGGSISNSTLGNHLSVERCNNLKLNSIHFESSKEEQIKISDSFISINGLFKWKNTTNKDIVVTSTKENNSNVVINNAQFNFYPFESTQTVPSIDFIEVDNFTNLKTTNIKYGIQLQKVNNYHSNILLQPKQLNPYNDNINLPDNFSVKNFGNNNNLDTYYPTNVSLTWQGGEYNKFIFVITDNPSSNKYVNKSNVKTIENSCFFYLRNDGIKARNCYVIVYGSNDNGTTYTRKWIVPVDDLGMIITNGENFNLSTYETSTDYTTEINSYILCNRVKYENNNYKLHCSTLVSTTYNQGDEIILPTTKYLYTSSGLKEFNLQ